MKYKKIKSRQTLTVKSRTEWRKWLSGNYNNTEVIWLVYYKKHTGKPTVTKAEAVEEAICFGWIDSLITRIDDQRYMQKFTPRKKSSIWSEVNKRTVIRLSSLGLIEPAGQVLIDYAKTSGEWSKDRGTPDVIEMPAVLAELLKTNQKAQEAWENLPPSYSKQFLLYVTLAKRDETKLRRSKKVIKMLISGQHPSML